MRVSRFARPALALRWTTTAATTPLFSGEFAVGRIYEERGAPAHLQWFWAITGIFGMPADMPMDGHAPTLESAQAQLGESWRKWLAWAKLAEIEG